jgi:hypothetical protein
MSTVEPMYPSAAIARIAKASEGGLHRLFRSASHKAAKAALDRLPQPPGFRKGTPPGMEQQEKMLWKRLVGEVPASPKTIASDHAILMRLWINWAYEHLDFDEKIRDKVGKYASALHRRSETSSGATSSEAEDSSSLFKSLHDASRAGRISREDVELLYTYGPFETDGEIEEFVSLCRPKADIEREWEYVQLPSKLHKVEQRLEAVESLLLEARAGQEQQSIFLEKAVQEQVRIRVSEFEISARANLEDIYSQVSHLEERLGLAQHKISDEVDKLSGRIVEREKDAVDLRERLGQLLASISSQEDLGQELQSRLTCLEQASRTRDELESSAAADNAASVERASAEYRGQIKVKRRKVEDVRPANDWLAVQAALRSRYMAVGVPPSEAARLAVETMAAIQAGQIVMFSGGLARTVAAACVWAIAGRSHVEVQVPIGLRGEPLLVEALDRCSTLEGDALRCLLIQGINRSSFDVIAGPLVERLVDKRLGYGDESELPVVIAVLSEGPGALPVTWHYGQLGPVFDTDALSWRPRLSSSARELADVYIPPSITPAKSVSMDLALESTAADLLQYLTDEGGVHLTPLVRHTVLAAARFISSEEVNEDDREAQLLDSLMFGWILPFLATQATARRALLNYLASSQLAWVRGPRLAALSREASRGASADVDLGGL